MIVGRNRPLTAVNSYSTRRSRSALVLPASFLASTACPSSLLSSTGIYEARRHQSGSAYTKDQRRNLPGADPNSAQQTQLVEGPDMTYHMRFGSNTLAHVGVPEVSEDVRNRSDLEKDRDMKRKYGDLGPGDTPKKNASGVRRDMLEAQQDIDGLPWEVRWRKNLIPTHEEVIQDIRDRFDLYIQDPMEREVEWYLHWKDRGFRVQKDRLIWPQGFTDYLDHYDEFGRRRVLPSDQKWSDSSWKYLADAKYRDRMWLIEGEERKAVHLQLAPQEQLIAEEEKRLSDIGDVVQGLSAGVIDLDEDQMYQALSGTADPLEVAKTKAKINSYGATEALRVAKGEDIPPEQLDPISGFPKSSLEPLPTGITVEQGAKIAMMGGVQREYVEQAGEMAQSKGLDPLTAVLKAQHHLAKKAGDQPGISTLVEGKVEHMKQLASDYQRLQNSEGTAPSQGSLAAAVGALEDNIQRCEGQDKATEMDMSGFVDVTPRPEGHEPNVAPELYSAPQTDISMGKVGDGDVPEWYRQQLIDTQPLIRTYNLVGDPLETASMDSKYLTKETASAAAVDSESAFSSAPHAQPTSVLDDNANLGESAFDEMKLHRLRTMPELAREFQPLPTFKEVSKQERLAAAATAAGANVKPMKKSEKLRQERLERQRKAKVEMDTDILLPTLPWESDSIPDPYRGVARDDDVDGDGVALVDVPKKDLEATWMAYRNFFRQTLTEFGNLSRTVSEDRCVQMLLDSVQKIRRDEVGEHPQIPKEHLDVVQLVYEGHVKQFISDFFKSANIRTSEVQVYKSESDDILRKASAKSKLLGKNFMNFIQEMISLELDGVRKNPVQKHAIMLRDKKLEPIAKPFGRWIETQLKEFIVTDYTAPEQIDQYKEALLRSLKDARFKTPMRIEGITDGSRDATVEALFQWCAGTLMFYAAKHMFRLFIEHGETRFRGRAEDYSETANEYFGCSFKAASSNVTLPVPETDPFWEYDDRDFLDGENAVTAELIGNLEKAEGIWHSGSHKVWYPLLDETEFMWFCERRGRYNTAIDVSDRCLENLNKRTHPSIHPFPERARKFLEGAPLTQETAEHLWMQYMGDVYVRHSDFMSRMGRFETALNYREKALNLYHLAIRTAGERLPQSWTAPLLTRAKYLCCSAGFGDLSPEEHMKQVDALMERMYALNPTPRHWIDPDADLPFRIAVFVKAIPVMGQMITDAAAKKVQIPDEAALQKFAQNRARGGAYTELEWFRATNDAAEDILRKRVLKWRSKEVEGSDAWLFWTHLYFTFRVQPKSAEQVQQFWDMYEPVFLQIYTQAAMCSRPRGVRLISDALRRMMQILVPGNADHHKILMKELVNVREKLSHLINVREMDRSINTLEAFMIDPSKATAYVYGTEALHRDMVSMNKLKNNTSLKIDLAAKDYHELVNRTAKMKANSGHFTANEAFQNASHSQGDEEFNSASMTAKSDTEAQISTKKMFQ